MLPVELEANSAENVLPSSSSLHSTQRPFIRCPDSPALRTGPPRSFSASYSLPSSPLIRQNIVHGYFQDEEPPLFQPFTLRAVQEYSSSKGKQRASRVLEGTPHESPTEERSGFDLWRDPEENRTLGTNAENRGEPLGYTSVDAPMKRRSTMRRALSAPQPPLAAPAAGRARWGRLRSLLPTIVRQERRSAYSSVAAPSVNIGDELTVGGLSALILRLWFERDEKGHRRIPVLFRGLRLHISDSLNPMHMKKSVFRIECEYENGARWVIYRELRDFLSLHLHYTVSNAYHRDIGRSAHIPDFPKSSIPYLSKFMKKEDAHVTQAEFARRQREALEDYLVRLTPAVMFLPSANLLAAFLELSALFIHQAQSGGNQYKAGYLKIQSIASGDGFGRKSSSWWGRNEERWCAVRDTYLVFLDDPGETSVWDVFILDPHFEVRRPRRYYRQGLNMLRLTFVHDRLFSRSKPALDNSDPFRLVLGHSASLHDMTSQLPTPMLLDPSTNANLLSHPAGVDSRARKNGELTANVSTHTFYVVNSQMRLKLRAPSERQMLQWMTALERAAAHCRYAGKNRFGSFAPVRLNVAAQWLVDGRDYFWNLSRAISLAKESIYIHDWWISPELQLRRPAKDHYRLDRLLQRKAKEGVKIYIILYQEVFSKTTPTDSSYTKQKLMSLHPNIMVQRSPSHLPTGILYWAHHEKLCVIDQMIAFMGGIDLCFARWDSPQHVLTDDDPELQIWQGKDYSNPRVRDFYELNKPFEDMYDRSKVPRMPWHDVGLQIVGQPAHDLARHFVQRWNWLLRIKNHSREMPCLLPPPEMKDCDLVQDGLTGTCELQICRSAGQWSMGTLGHVEHSIQTAYIKAIQRSEHFVYIENQFFITSTIINETRVENKIGDALVDRIIQAHKDKKPWRCCVLIPLLPGFTSPVDHGEANALRIILECQNRTISRGPHSIYARLRKEGIEPDDYISFFSLRNWGKLRDGTLTTEQVYIHGKVCIVDDRLAIIGSANINERSQRGDRDSEIAAIIRDTEMIDGRMAGGPFKVGRFAHSLRVRLMREHLGIDVDSLDEETLATNEPVQPTTEQEVWDPDAEQGNGQQDIVSHIRISGLRNRANVMINEVLDSMGQATLAAEGETAKTAKALRRLGLNRKNTIHAGSTTLSGDSNDKGQKVPGFAVPTLKEKNISEQNKSDCEAFDDGRHREGNTVLLGGGENGDVGETICSTKEPLPEDGGRLGAPANSREGSKVSEHAQAQSDAEESGSRARSDLRKSPSKVWTLPTPRPLVDPGCFEDPVVDSFWKVIWMASAVRNTEIYRKVFRIVPDDLVTTWNQYKEFVSYHERMHKPSGDTPLNEGSTRASYEGLPHQDTLTAKRDSGSVERKAAQRSKDASHGTLFPRPRRKSDAFDKTGREGMEKLLGQLNGHLVLYPTRFLEGEDVVNNFLFNADRLLPLPIYN